MSSGEKPQDTSALKAKYAKLIVDLITTIRRASFYPTQHPMVAGAIKNVFAQLSELLSQKESLTLDISPDNKILIDGEPVEGRGSLIADNMSHLKKSNIENLTFNKGVAVRELEGLIRFMLLNAATIKDMGGMPKLFSDNKIEHIRTNQFSYIKINKDEEALVTKVSLADLENLKGKIKAFTAGKLTATEEVAALEKQMVSFIEADLKEHKAVSLPLRTMLKSYLGHSEDALRKLEKVRSDLADKGVSSAELEALVTRIEVELARPKTTERKSYRQEYEKLLKEHRTLEGQITALRQVQSGMAPGIGPISEPSAGPENIDSAAVLALQKENHALKTELGKFKDVLKEKSELINEVETEVKLAHEDKQDLEAIVHHLTESVVVVDKQEHILMMNPSAETLLGVSTQDIGKPLREIIKDEHLLTLVHRRAHAHAPGSPEIELYSPNEETGKTLIGSSAVIENHLGKTLGMVTVLQDVAKRKAIEQQKIDFFAKVTHELRSPLIAMDKSLALLLSKAPGELNADQENFISIVSRNAKRLTLLLNDLLDLAKLEARKMQLIIEPGLIGKAIEESVEVFKPWAHSNNIALVKKIQPGLPMSHFDTVRLIQVINNLLSNAIKFTPDGGSITVEAGLSQDGQLQVSVRDTGQGIPADEIPRMFQRYYQISSAVGARVQGTGIGLTVAKEIVEMHEGRIWVESQVGLGTSFIFTLPVREVDPATQRSLPPAEGKKPA